MLFQALVAPRITVEHEFVSLLLSVDGLQHPLLTNVPWTRDCDEDFQISVSEFENTRVYVLSCMYGHSLSRELMLSAIIATMSARILNAPIGACKERNEYVSFLLNMFEAIKDQFVVCQTPEIG